MAIRIFIICPIGDNKSPSRNRLDGNIKEIYKPVLNDLGIYFKTSMDLKRPGSITNQIIEELYNSEIVIADLTGFNPNVMYELGVRHTFMKPVIMVAEDTSKLPFDIGADRVLNIKVDLSELEETRKELKEYILGIIKEIDQDSIVIDNPVSRGIKWMEYEVFASSSNELVLKELKRLTYVVDSISKSVRKYKKYGDENLLQFTIKIEPEVGPEQIRELMHECFVENFGEVPVNIDFSKMFIEQVNEWVWIFLVTLDNIEYDLNIVSNWLLEKDITVFGIAQMKGRINS